MNLFSLLTFLSFLTYLFLGFYLFRLDKSSMLNRTFLGVCLSFAIWALSSYYIFPGGNKSSIWFWYKISAFGWCLFPAFLIHYMILLSKQHKVLAKWWIYLFIYLPAPIFLFRVFTGTLLATDFVSTNVGVMEVHGDISAWYILYVTYFSLYTMLGIFLVWRWGRNSKSKREKIQANLIVWSGLITSSLGSTTNLSFPVLKIVLVPAIAPILILIWILTIVYAVARFKLMAFTSNIASDEIVANIRDLIILINPQEEIVKINSQTQLILGYNEKELLGKPFKTILAFPGASRPNFSLRNVIFKKVVELKQNNLNPSITIEEVNRLPNVNDESLKQNEYKVNLLSKEKVKIPIGLSFSIIKDTTGDEIGSVIIGHDLRPKLRLIDEIKERKQAEASLHISNNELKQSNTQLDTTLQELRASHHELKETQKQLVQAEKMASLGQLTAGIAHEIKNPLNFVNNFSEISGDLLNELREEMEKVKDSFDRNIFDDMVDLIDNLEQNAKKINEHGKRADSIVKGMLLHSRGKSGEKRPTNFNNLITEYINLAYHGMRAQDDTFNIKIETEFDDSIGVINIVPQDFSRALLNIVTNACYSTHLKKKEFGNGYNPVLRVTTQSSNDKYEVRIYDNGKGIPQNIIDKIYQPFFTTKPPGSGTGLGLSITYEIIVHEHNGTIKIETREGEFAEFIITLPKQD
ncbi:MAG: ATP-binding protein [Ignavibacteriaceae bacterium]